MARILIVEDEEKIARFVTLELEHEGYQVEHAADGRTAVDLALERDYDLILAMELEHIEQVTAIAPEARGKMMLFGHWTGRKEIPDPYRKNRDAFEYVYGLLEQASLEWAKRLS